MHLRTLSLRNYRVYRSVDLEFPDGLIGIYGANGAGKSTLIESLRFAIYGDSRTDKWELRSAGVGDDVRVELVFEHEGNTYDVRRRLKGRNLTPEVEVFLNGQLAAQSVREANAYLARVVGMDQRAFLASVCAQQKELTSFATMVPGERRRLVLDLLGVSPVERALARVRERGRDAKTEAAGARAGLARAAADGHREEAERHEARAAEADRLGPEIEAATARVAELAAAAAPLEALERDREQATARANLVTALEEARARLRTSERALSKAEADAEGAAGLVAARVEAERALVGLDEELAAARERHAELSEAAGAAANRLEAATNAHAAAADLDPDAPCPTCGQPLGAAHDELRRRHAEELAAATAA